MKSRAGELEADALPAGGADFFQAILEHRGLRAMRPPLASLAGIPALFVCGSASRTARDLESIAAARGMPVIRMPDHENPAVAWSGAVVASIKNSAAALMTIGRPTIDRSPGAGQRLLTNLAEAVRDVLQRAQIATMFLEGGATASAVCRRMDWNDLAVIGELAGGVVALQADTHRIVIKPGSYTWPQQVFDFH
jgi:uncharacterized protein YgbK (DUF1537 family)